MTRTHRSARTPVAAARFLPLLLSVLCLALVVPSARADDGAPRAWDIAAGPLAEALERVARRADQR